MDLKAGEKQAQPPKEDVSKAHNFVLPKTVDKDFISKLPIVRGYNFDNNLSFEEFIKALATTGFQASELYKAIQVVKTMKQQKATIFLSYTSNIVSSGLREAIAWLVKNKKIHVLITTAGGVEEDIIKSLEPFRIGDFKADDIILRNKGIQRIGNIYAPVTAYELFEKLSMRFFDKLLALQKQRNNPIKSTEFSRLLGLEINDNNSILYWASKNNIPVFCPALTDGSIGDMIYFYNKQKSKEKDKLLLDIALDVESINDLAVNAKKTGIIAIGGGLPKHHAINANIFRGGADFAVYITTGSEFDGSLSTARPEEAITWGKLKPASRTAFVNLEASVAFPLLITGAFID